MMRTGEATRQEAIIHAIGPHECLTTAELVEKTGRPGKQVATATCALVLQDYLERVERGCFRLTIKGKELLASGKRLKTGARRSSGKRAKPRATLRQRTWNAMRIKGKFTLEDICLLVGDGQSEPYAAVQAYVRLLVRHGYVVELFDRAADDKPTSNGLKVFRLVKDTGDLAPSHNSETGALFDRNLKQVAS